MNHSPGPWSIHEDGECILDANGHHFICFGHGYDDVSGFFAPNIGRQKDQAKKEAAISEGDKELVRMAPTMLADIFNLRDWIMSAGSGDVDSLLRVINDTDNYEQYR